jgi:hypothetical protein
MVKPCRCEPSRFKHENAAASCGQTKLLAGRPRACPIYAPARFCFLRYGKRHLAGPMRRWPAHGGGNLFCDFSSIVVCPVRRALPPIFCAHINEI